jgi:hypothetical protein
MGIKSFLLKPYTAYIAKDVNRWSENAEETQRQIMYSLVKMGAETAYGRDRAFHKIKDAASFAQQIPLNDYEDLKPYIDRILEGESDVLWPGRPKYYAKTSGTTSGVKYIPITKESLPNHFGTARNALFNYAHKTGRGEFIDGKLIFLSGSPEMYKIKEVPTGRLSGIANHLVPAWVRKGQMPSYSTNCIEDWETKLDAIVEETWNKDMRLISGIPPWVQMYFERLLIKSGKQRVADLFPNFSVFVYGGVNFEPYREALFNLIGDQSSVLSVELYPASEGFIAFQDEFPSKGLLLNTNSGIYFEFVPVEYLAEPNPKRLNLSQVEVGVNYALILNTNAGLWGYEIGDTIEFLSLRPFRIRVTGRTKHFISAFGEHVIVKEVENAMMEAAKINEVRVVEFTVAPQVNPPKGGLPYHEWFVEFDSLPNDLTLFAAAIDRVMQEQNIYYQDLIDGRVLQPAVITPIRKGGFIELMRTQGKLGGQNKIPKLGNDRKLASVLELYKLQT